MNGNEKMWAAIAFYELAALQRAQAEHVAQLEARIAELEAAAKKDKDKPAEPPPSPPAPEGA